MSVDESMRVLSELEDAFNARDWPRFEALHAESVSVVGPFSPEPVKGRVAHRESLEGLLKAFPDLRTEARRRFGQGDWMCEESVITGTHRGPIEGPAGMTLSPTGKAIRFTLCTVSRVQGGEVLEEHSYFDVLGVATQLFGLGDLLAGFDAAAGKDTGS